MLQHSWHRSREGENKNSVKWFTSAVQWGPSFLLQFRIYLHDSACWVMCSCTCGSFGKRKEKKKNLHPHWSLWVTDTEWEIKTRQRVVPSVEPQSDSGCQQWCYWANMLSLLTQINIFRTETRFKVLTKRWSVFSLCKQRANTLINMQRQQPRLSVTASISAALSRPAGLNYAAAASTL